MKKAYTFDDFLLLPKYSDVLPSQVLVSSQVFEQKNGNCEQKEHDYFYLNENGLYFCQQSLLIMKKQRAEAKDSADTQVGAYVFCTAKKLMNFELTEFMTLLLSLFATLWRYLEHFML